MLIFDRINTDQSKRRMTEEGYMVVPANLARVGMYDYKAGEIGMPDADPLKPIKVYRPASAVFDAESMASFSLKPVTNGHPPEMVNVKNIKKYQVGNAAGIVGRNGEFLTTDLLITDEAAIKNIQDGDKVEVSNGYTADFDYVRGETETGEVYDAVMKNIRGNHIALVSRARGGRGCRVSDHEQMENKAMKKIVLDAVEHEVPEQVASHIEALGRKVTDAEASADASKTAHDAEVAGLKQQIADAEAKIPSGAAIDVLIESRLKLVTDAKSLVADLDCAGKTDEAVIEAVVLKVFDGISLEGKDADYKKIYCKALFDSALLKAGKTGDGSDKVKVVVSDTAPNGDKARIEFIKRSETLYKK